MKLLSVCVLLASALVASAAPPQAPTVEERLAALEARVDAMEKGKKVATGAAPCVCGDSCKCAPGVCPACPTASTPARLTINGVVHECGPDGCYRAVGGSCANGQCGASQTFAAQTSFGGSCAGGSCGAAPASRGIFRRR